MKPCSEAKHKLHISFEAFTRIRLEQHHYHSKKKKKKSHLLQESIKVVLTFQGTCFLVRVQDITIPALAVIGGIAVDTYVFAVMSHGTGVQT